ncbi:hypothetical protein EYZ11_007933 [Aspergillus tanneri]|nr:hypothetical protein EYZ11_007933 [Aspergillus tanneri]
MHRPVGINLASTYLCFLLVVGRILAAVPYIPSYLLYDSQNNASFAYLLRSESPEGTTQLLSLNISEQVESASPKYRTLLEEVPFRVDNQTSSFVPVIDRHGIIKAYTGNCQSGQEHAAVWQFTPDTKSSIGNGTWETFALNGTDDQEKPRIRGPNYLSGGFSYAPSNDTDTSIYAFGGMCPSLSVWGETWMAAADYSQTMTVLDPSASDSPPSYQISTTGERAPPIPEAGFTITPLLPTYGSTPTGRLLRQQNFLMIGGHTRHAFINMSQLAVFSLPQNSWSIVDVGSPLNIEKTELAVRKTPVVEPRSGHTAILSPDGGKVIVFGGWVGNTSAPARPQLAVLELGDDYTSPGGWTWKIPSEERGGSVEGSGIYGHGVTMLPGGVMMVAGGYQIPRPSKRSTTGPQLNTQIHLYNVTSGSWVSSYANPNHHPAQKTGDTDTERTMHSSTSRTIGLGAGLGLGIPAVAGAAVFIWFYCRRRRVRQTRDQNLRKLALDAQRNHFWGQEDPFIASSIRRPPMREADTNSDYPWNNNRGVGHPSSWQDNGDAVAERTGLLMDTPSPTKSSRPILNARMYRPPAPYNEYRRSDGTGDIHPIDEREEDEAQPSEQMAARESMEPFLTPKTTVTIPDHPYATEDAVPTVAAGVGCDDDEHSSTGKNDRTSSNLSDSSTSVRSAHPPNGTVFNHPPSLRSSGRESPEKSCSASSHSREGPHSRPDSATIPHEKRYSSESFSTAHTTLSQRQAEGERLLQEDGPEPHTFELFPRPLSIAKPRASEWIGNVRRVLSVTRKRAPANDDWTNAASVASGIDRGSNVLAPSKASSTHDAGIGMQVPRRSVSASAELFRRKQGARDWGAGNRVSRDMSFHTLTRDDFALDGLLDVMSEDEDWDVEGAAEGRRVQIAYTVPKERLRVVNATARDMDNFSEKSISRSNSEA